MVSGRELKSWTHSLEGESTSLGYQLLSAGIPMIECAESLFFFCRTLPLSAHPIHEQIEIVLGKFRFFK